MMQHKGLTAQFRFVADVGVYVGEIVNIADVIAFSANTIDSLREAMIAAVEHYLAECIEANADLVTGADNFAEISGVGPAG